MEAYVGAERAFWPVLLAQWREHCAEACARPLLRVCGTTPERIVAAAPYLARLGGAQAREGPACVVDTACIDVVPRLDAAAACGDVQWLVAVLRDETAADIARAAATALFWGVPRVVLLQPEEHVPRRGAQDYAHLFFYCRRVCELVPGPPRPHAGPRRAWSVCVVDPPQGWKDAHRRRVLCAVEIGPDGECCVSDGRGDA